MNKMKGQSSVELTIVVGIALVLSSPFILASQSSIIELRDASRFLKLDQSLDEVREKSIELNNSNYPARRIVDFRSPDGVQKIYNPKLDGGSALIFEMTAQGSRVNRSIIMGVNLNLTKKDQLKDEGTYDLSLRKTENGINASVIQ